MSSLAQQDPSSGPTSCQLGLSSPAQELGRLRRWEDHFALALLLQPSHPCITCTQTESLVQGQQLWPVEHPVPCPTRGKVWLLTLPGTRTKLSGVAGSRTEAKHRPPPEPPSAWPSGLNHGSAGVDTSLNQPCQPTDLWHKPAHDGPFPGPSLAQAEGVKLHPQSPTPHMHIYVHGDACDPSHSRHIGTCTSLPPCPALRVTIGTLGEERRRHPSTPLTKCTKTTQETCPQTRDRPPGPTQ